VVGKWFDQWRLKTKQDSYVLVYFHPSLRIDKGNNFIDISNTHQSHKIYVYI